MSTALLEEKAEWARKLLAGKPEPYYKRSGLVSITTIAGADDEDLMKRFHAALNDMDQRGTMPSTREFFPQLLND